MARKKAQIPAKPKELITYQDHKNNIIRLIYELGTKYGTYNVFEDFITMLAYEISNSVDIVHYEERAKSYKKIYQKYSKEEITKIGQITASLTMGLTVCEGSKDLLGEVYHGLCLHNEHNGQFFTPINICDLMADMACLPNLKDMKKKGYITVMEPTCGSGAMLIGASNSLRKRGYNPQTQMCCLAVDNDFRCCMMAYIQLSLLGIPAVVIHGDSLLVKEYSRFYTPFYLLNGWLWREPMGMTDKRSIDDEKLRCVFEPAYYLLKYGLNKLK